MNASPALDLNQCSLCSSTKSRRLQSGVRDYEYQAPGEYSWVECMDCGSIRIDPMPSNEVLQQAYPPHYHAFQKPSSGITSLLIQKSRESLADNLAKKLPPGGAILDNGCSTGELLHSVGQKGNFKLYGVEYMAETAEIARQKGIEVWQGSIEDADIPANSMDLITMQHVLEHVYDPKETLKKCHRALKPGGRIMGELPNFDSWDANLFGKYWGGGHAPRHIWHFTPKTLKETIESAGFQVVRISPALHTGHWALSLQNYFRRKRTDSKGLHCGRTWYYPWLLLLFVPLNMIQMVLLKTGIMRFEAIKK